MQTGTSVRVLSALAPAFVFAALVGASAPASADFVFWWSGTDIYRQDVTGGPLTNIRSGVHATSQRGAGLKVVGDRLYMFESRWVSSMDFDGQDFTRHQQFPYGFYSSFTTDGAYAFATDDEQYREVRLDLSDGTATNLPGLTGGPIGGMDIDTTNHVLYVGRETSTWLPLSGSMSRTPVAGGGLETHERDVKALTLDIAGGRIFWSSGAWYDHLYAGELNMEPGDDFISNPTLLAVTDWSDPEQLTGGASEMAFHAGSNQVFYSAWNKRYGYVLDLDDNTLSQFTDNLVYNLNGVSVSPEPSAMALLATGGVGLLLWSWRGLTSSISRIFMPGKRGP